MASNSVPNGQSIRLRLANSEVTGINDYGAQIGLTVVTAPILSAKIAAFLSADNAATLANTDKSNKQVVLNDARNAGFTLAGVVKRFVTDLPGFGTTPSAQWEELGFARGSLEIPRKVVEVMLGRMAAFFAAHPGDESAPRGVTAQNCTDKMNAIIAARGAVETAQAVYVGFKTTEDAAFKALGVTMGDLVKELKLHLSGDDARWYAFGLRRPDDPETPAQPHGLLLASAGSGRVFADWDDVPGATRYHVWLGQGDEKAVRVESVEDSQAFLPDLIVGTTIKVYIVASNEGGESVASDVVQIVVS